MSLQVFDGVGGGDPALWRAEWPSDAEQEALLRAFGEPFPAGYRAWCRSARVPVGGRGMKGWGEEAWHRGHDEAMLKGDVFLLKARDRHWTTENILRLLWYLMWQPESAGFYETYSEAEAYQGIDSFKNRMEVIYRDLPRWQREAAPVANGNKGEFGTQGEVEVAHVWREPRSRAFLRVATATKHAGAAGAYTHAVMDEMARYEDADGALEALRPSVYRTGGHILMGSTLTTESHTGTRLVMEWLAAREAGRGTALFIGYGSRAGETKERYAEMETEARRQGPMRLLELHRQYPRTAEEALAEASGGLLDSGAVERCYKHQAALEAPPRFARWARLGEEPMRFYREPQPGATYVMGMDPAAGRGGGDFGSLTILDARTGEEVVAFRSNEAGYGEMARLAWELHQHGYRVAKGNLFLQRGGGLVPEANNEALMEALWPPGGPFDLEYFYIQEKGPTPQSQEERPFRYGFWTGGNKTDLLNVFAEQATQGSIAWHNPWLAQEVGRWALAAGRWEYQVRASMRAILGHGDVTMSMALATMGVLALNQRRAQDEEDVEPVWEPKVYMNVTGRPARPARREV